MTEACFYIRITKELPGDGAGVFWPPFCGCWLGGGMGGAAPDDGGGPG